MSLTSYRAAPPRVRVFFGSFRGKTDDLRSGGDLLSHVLRRSTIGAARLNDRVRDGIGCFLRALATRPAEGPLFRGVSRRVWRAGSRACPVFGCLFPGLTLTF